MSRKNFKKGILKVVAPVMETEEDITATKAIAAEKEKMDFITDVSIPFDGSPESVNAIIAAGFQVKQDEPCEVDIYLDGELKGVANVGDFINRDGSITRPQHKF